MSVARVVLAGSLAHNKTRSLVSVLAIALGVALGYAVQLITQTAVNEFALGIQTLSGDADLQVRGPRNGFDEVLYPELAQLPEVAAASPVLEVDAKLADRNDALRVVGIDAFRAVSVQPGLMPMTSDRLDLLRPDRLFLSPAAARWLNADADTSIVFQVGLRDVPLYVAGLAPAETQQRFALMDIAAAQASFDRLGRLTRIDVRLRPGIDIATFRDQLQQRLPPGIAVERPEAGLAASVSASRSYRVNLNVLALVALFTGGLLVFSTQALAVVRRRTQLALLRVLGVTRGRLVRLLVAEGALIGVAGGVLGLIGGSVIAQAAVRLIGPDLGSGYFRGITPTLTPSPIALGVSFGLGIAVAMLGSLIPAYEAVRAQPALALRAGDEQRAFARLNSPWPGIATLGTAVIASMLPPVAGLPLFGYFAIALLLLGTLMLMPRLAALLLAIAPTPHDAAPQLALLQLRGAPGQAAVSLAAIVASMSLMISMAIMVTSFRDALDAWLERILPADAYIRASASSDSAYITPDDQAQIAAAPGVRRAEFLREQQLLLDPSRPRVVLLARSIDAANPARQLPLVTAVQAPVPDAPPPLWVNEAMLDVYGFAPGDRVELPIGGRSIPFTIAGVWRDYARPQGAIVIERERYIALTDDRTATNGALWLSPGTDLEQLRHEIAERVAGGARLEIAAPGEIREVSLKVFDRTFAVTYALELAAVMIGLLGLSSSFGALVLARRREFGMLRHIGMSRRQIGTMLATEGLTVSAIGLVVGLGLGCVISVILIDVVNRQSFHWSMGLSIPWPELAGSALLVLALSTITAVASGRAAMSDDVVRAVKDDW
jgi:putative ABC transport system permease protein